MKSRHRAREIALQILYQYDLAQHSANQSIPTGTALVRDLRNHYEHFQVQDTLQEFVGQLVAGTLTQMAQLDTTLEKHTSNWKVSRLSSVDRSLLRMALYEMTQFPEVPRSVVINEAIELAKQFGTADSPSFINGVLDQIQPSETQKDDALSES